MRPIFAAPLLLANFAGAALAPRIGADPAQVDFFEQRIRPVLVNKCYKCHSADSEKVKGGLLLDTRAGVLAGGDNGAIVVPGDPKKSSLIQSLRWVDKDTQMPPKEQLPADVVADFEKWIEMGVPDPREGDAKAAKAGRAPIDIEKGREFWAFQAPKAVASPAVKNTAWPRTDVDRFILASLEEKNLQPVADAEPRTLVRRLYFDLIGLPPTPDEVEAFVKAASENRRGAVETVVDKLLASPQFGERWGRHWLDVARYAESTGKERNFTFPNAWRYRDWVVAAVNADKPYDQFIREQIAGDLLSAKDGAERDALTVATGFLALGPKSINEKKKEQFRMDLIDEQIDVMSKAVLGVTVACARCHDHKFDPIRQSDYYALAGIFGSTRTLYGTDSFGGKNRNASALISLGNETGPTAPKELSDQEKRFEMLSKIKPKAAETMKNLTPEQEARLDTRFGSGTQSATPAASSPEEMQKRLEAFAAGDPKKLARLKNLSPEQRARLAERFAGTTTPAPSGEATTAKDAELEKMIEERAKGDPKKLKKLKNLSPEQRARLAERFGGAASLQGLATANNKKYKAARQGSAGNRQATTAPQCMGVQEGSPGDAHILTRGEVDQPADLVPRGFVEVLSTKTPPAVPAAASGRLQLADWLTSRDNPQTARVMVNRVWAHLFGQGLVRTPDNFGATGEKPTNPALLDTLAVQFMNHGWSVKQLVRSIVLSRTYQLGSGHDSAANETDPDNRLVWHQAPRRLDAEAIRDAMLAASGKLDLTPAPNSYVFTIGDSYIGKGIKPESFTEYESLKRSVYLPIVRDCVPEVLDLFDFAEPSLVVAARDVTNVPSQALYLMNNPFVREQAGALAKRVLALPGDDGKRIDSAYQFALGRSAASAEIDRARAYLAGQSNGLVSAKSGDQAKANELAWTTFCQALFACAEFRYLR